MACDIPFDLDRAWLLSDVILLAENAEGRELHVSRALLSSSSPVFRAMFSSPFEESSQDRIKISSDYKVLKEVLRLLYHSSCNCLTTKMNGELLFSMYNVADKWDLPNVRKRILGMSKVVNYGIYEQILEMFGEQDGDVPCAIPEYFDAPWFFSDAEVVSKDGVRFHVSKVLLSNCSFFCSEFNQKSSIEFPIHSSVLKEILHRMHHIRCECSTEITDLETLVHLHLTASWLDIPRMEVTPLPLVDAFIKVLEKEKNSSVRQEQKSTLISMCQKLDRWDLLIFLSSDDPRPFFSKEDIATICKIAPIMERPPRVVADFQLEAESSNSIVPISFKKPWNFFNLMIKTKNYDGTPLYARKEVLMNHSQFFMKKFLGNEWSEGKSPEGYDIITVDEEYPTLHRIVAAVHGCHKGINSGCSAPFIYDIYQLSCEDKLDIPLVRDLCLKVIVKPTVNRDTPSKLELAILLKLDISCVLHTMTEDDMRKWLDGCAATHSYFKNDKEIVFETKSDELIFSVNVARKMCRRLIKEEPANPFSYLLDELDHF